jgi:hypothetical protein
MFFVEVLANAVRFLGGRLVCGHFKISPSALCMEIIAHYFLRERKREVVKYEIKLSCYTPWWRLRGEETQLLLVLDLGTRWWSVVKVTHWPHFSPRERIAST